tara:strand:- start:468 stop:656 length:189 start_codon:yes stop_codon:yes gene_type:complete
LALALWRAGVNTAAGSKQQNSSNYTQVSQLHNTFSNGNKNNTMGNSIATHHLPAKRGVLPQT